MFISAKNRLKGDEKCSRQQFVSCFVFRWAAPVIRVCYSVYGVHIFFCFVSVAEVFGDYLCKGESDERSVACFFCQVSPDLVT
jgi:hypothetical protein